MPRPDPGRVLAVDPGRARAGLALSDETRTLASPYRILDASDRLRLVHAIAAICKEEEVTRVLVGLPLHMSGATGAAAQKAAELAQKIADATGLDVELVDERLTSVEADRRRNEGGGKRKAREPNDDAAAAVLLQAWLDRP